MCVHLSMCVLDVFVSVLHCIGAALVKKTGLRQRVSEARYSWDRERAVCECVLTVCVHSYVRILESV